MIYKFRYQISMSRIINTKWLILITLTVLCAYAAEQPYRKIIHNSDPKAKCLDGSSPAIYLHEGGDKKNFLIFFNGGGYCAGANLQQTLENCYQRSKTELGTSKVLPETLTIPGGYLSTDPALSKFATWTKVFINYCDGSLHQGSTDIPYSYKDAQLYFRGADNTRSHFKWLQATYDFTNAEKVLLTGASAGGIATYLWTNYVRSLLVNPAAVYSVPDSGVFINAASPQTGVFKLDVSMQSLFKVSNVNENTPITTCNRFLVGQQYKCLFLQNAFTSVEGKVLLINSQYDSWAISNILDIKCLKDGKSGQTLSGCSSSQIANIEVYRRSYLNFLSNFLQFSWHNVWTISCSQHVYAAYGNFYDVPEEKIPEATGLTVKDAIERFVLNNERIASVDQQPWPSNTACAN